MAYLEVYGRLEEPRPAATGRSAGQLAPHLTRAWRLGKAGPSNCRHAARRSLRARRTPRLRRMPAGMPAVVQLRAEFGLTKAEARLAL